MDKSQRFLELAKGAKKPGLSLQKYYKSWRLTLRTWIIKKGLKVATINLSHDLPLYADPFTYILLVMRYANINTIYVVHSGTCVTYTSKDLYKLHDRHFSNRSASDIFDELLERSFDRDKYYHRLSIEPEIEETKQLAKEIREEIYHLFRYFSDEQLKALSRSLFGVSKRFDNDAVKLLQAIKRIANYNDKMGEAIEIIENFEKSFEEKHQHYLCCNGYGRNSWSDAPVTYKAVLNFIDSARKGSEELYQRTFINKITTL